MNSDEVKQHINTQINRMLNQKGLPGVDLKASDRFLGGEIQMDSLDLAVLVTELEQLTGKDPFKEGFRNFRTVGELASLYAD